MNARGSAHWRSADLRGRPRSSGRRRHLSWVAQWQPQGAQQLGAAGALQLGTEGAQHDGAGAQQVGAAGAQQVGAPQLGMLQPQP